MQTIDPAQVQIRPLRKDELRAWVKLCRQSFREAYLWKMDLRDLNCYIQNSLTPERLNSEFASAQKGEREIWVVEEKGSLNGYGVVVWNQKPPLASSDHPAETSVELSRLYLLNEHQKKGQGRALLSHLIERAIIRGAQAIWLSVWTENRAARALYAKNAFYLTGYQDFPVGEDIQRDEILIRTLI